MAEFTGEPSASSLNLHRKSVDRVQQVVDLSECIHDLIDWFEWFRLTGKPSTQVWDDARKLVGRE